MIGRGSINVEPKSIMQAPYPQANERLFDEEAEQQMKFLMELSTSSAGARRRSR
jgi:valyl-tRNA synthetase